jgi:hypothetical protein
LPSWPPVGAGTLSDRRLAARPFLIGSAAFFFDGFFFRDALAPASVIMDEGMGDIMGDL